MKFVFSGPLLLIVEFCPYGNLRDFLRSNRPSLIDDKKAQLLTFRDLLSIAYQITRGMSYLSSKKVKYDNTYIYIYFSVTQIQGRERHVCSYKEIRVAKVLICSCVGVTKFQANA